MIKDLLQLRSYKRSLILFIIVFMLTSITQKNGSLQTLPVVMLTLGFGMFSVATFTYDEMARADRYLLTLPITKKDIIISKYVFIILSTIVGALIGMIASALIVMFVQAKIPEFLELLVLGISSICGIGIVEAIQIPCIIKYGPEKARIYQLLAVAILSFLIAGAWYLIGEWQITEMMTKIQSNLMQLLPIIFVLVTAIVYMISYHISYHIYLKKEL